MMTVQRMHKPVCINKETFKNPLKSDGACIMDVELIEWPTFVGWTDDDGGTKWSQDGSESGRHVGILQGGAS